MDISKEALKKLVGGIGRAQAMALLNNHILMELVSEAAHKSKNPHKLLSTMFERISARADMSPIESEAHPAIAEYRELLSIFFSTAAKRFPEGQ